MLYSLAMDHRRKRILLLLGVLDLVVIAVLGWYAWQLRQSEPPLAPELYAACSQSLLETLPSHLSPTVTWKQRVLYVRLTARYPTSTPPPSSAQLLWVVLDALKPLANADCLFPNEVVIVITAQSEAETHGHLIRLYGPDVADWAAGTLSEEELVKRGIYRDNATATPSEPAPRRRRY